MGCQRHDLRQPIQAEEQVDNRDHDVLFTARIQKLP